MLSTISKEEFDILKKSGFNRIPLVLECFADLDTPLSVYSKLANDRYSYLLESADGGNKYGRYSIIGLPAKIRIQIKKNIMRHVNFRVLILPLFKIRSTHEKIIFDDEHKFFISKLYWRIRA